MMPIRRGALSRAGPAVRCAAIVSAFMVALVFLAVPGARSGENPDHTIDMPIEGSYGANSSFYQASITASDVDADGHQELLVGNLNGMFYCFSSRGQLKWAYNCGAQIQGSPACADVDGNGRKEIFIGDLAGRMWGFSAGGSVLTGWGWPKQTIDDNGYVGVFSSPAIGDINGDGVLDVVVGTYGHRIYAWSFNGLGLPGWPYDNRDTVWSSPALADIDRDGVKEVIIGSDSTGGVTWPYPPGGLLTVLEGNGAMKPGFPIVTPEVLWSSPAVADIDGDGYYEIIIGTGHYYKALGRLTTEGHLVYAFNHDGSGVPGWPVPMAGSTFSSPAVGDVDGDGIGEIAICCNPMNGIGEDRVVIIRPNGQKILDIKPFGGPMMGSPALGDITGDGKADVIVGSGIQMCAWDYTGKVLWSQNMHNYVVTCPAVGDFDLDGNVEVAFATGDAAGGMPGGAFYVADCGKKADGEDSKLFPWPMFRRTDDHNGNVLNEGTAPRPPPPPPAMNFHEYILIMNPGEEDASVNVDLMNEKGEVRVVPWTVKPHARSTILVNNYMPGCGVSARVNSNVPVIAERSMYFNFLGIWKGGTDSIGTEAPATEWYLAEGSTASNFEEYVLVQNPGKDPVRVTMTFMREGAGPISRDFDIAGESRFTLNLKGIGGLENASVSTRVKATAGIIAERSMYFNYNGFVGGHVSVGVTRPANEWYLAEGYTAGTYDTFVMVQNPGDGPVIVDLNLMRKDGAKGKVSLNLPAQSRKTVMLDQVPGFDAAEVSTQVLATGPVVAERSMYFNSGGRTGGHNSIGISEPSDRWYLAEGYTGGSFDTFVLEMNPGDDPVDVKTTLLRGDGYVWSRIDKLPPHSRFTIHVDGIPGFENADVSTIVEAQGGGKVVAERSMYFVYGSGWADGHDSIGVSAPANTWYFAEGYTGI